MREFENLVTCPECGAVIYKPLWITLPEVAKLTGMHYNTIYRHRKEMGAVKRCGQWRFAVARVKKFMEG